MTAIQNDDPVGHCHGFDLVVSDIDHRRLKLLVKLGKFYAHGPPKRRVEVREGLVKEEDFRVAYDGPTNGHTLPLAAGKLAGFVIKPVRQIERGRCRFHASGGLAFRHFLQA